MRTIFILALAIMPFLGINAQTDSATVGNLTEQFPKLQPLKVDMTKFLPDKQKVAETASPVFHTEWQQFFVPSVSCYDVESDIRRAVMMPHWVTPMFDDVRVQPLFKIKSGKNSFSFGIGVNMDAVRRGIDFQRMEQHQQMMMPRR